MQIKQQLRQRGISQAAVAQAIGVSAAAIAQLVNHGLWPKTEELRARISAFLAENGIELKEAQTAATACPNTSSSEDENMLLAKQVLTPEAKRHFGLFRDPFADDAMQGCDDVFITPDIRYVREALYQTAVHGGFMAVIGESGAGKSTLRRDLIERIHREKAKVIVIEPYVIAMEDNDVKGKTLKAAAIAEAIINTVAPVESIKRSQDARFRQLHKVLKDSNEAKFSHVLVIEEAHSLPVPTLKHLKRFFELESGFKKLLSIVLIGQPELMDKLSERYMDVREVVQRCEIVNLPALGNSTEAYLNFKFNRVGKAMTEVMDISAIDAIQTRLSRRTRDGVISVAYPLVLENLVIAAMNQAADISAPVINADTIEEVCK